MFNSGASRRGCLAAGRPRYCERPSCDVVRGRESRNNDPIGKCADLTRRDEQHLTRFLFLARLLSIIVG